MLSFNEREEELFFDTSDSLSSDESLVSTKNDTSSSNSEFEIWISEPKSVIERRENFLRNFGFIDSMGFERIVECSGAVSSSCIEEKMDSIARESDSEANCLVDELKLHCLDVEKISPERENVGYFLSDAKGVKLDEKKVKNWWKVFKNKMKRQCGKNFTKLVNESSNVRRVKVKQKKKNFSELSAVFVRQEFHAHEGLIRTMKFSPNGQYLASGGEDGAVRIWHVTLAKPKCNNFYDNAVDLRKKKFSNASVVIPNEVFQIEELPVQEFYGHTGDILDLAWSDSNRLLSSSKDNTVRLWELGSDKCLGIFRHNTYVACVQFNPVDENYFVSGSVDGKVRIWGIRRGRVVDWIDVFDVVTAISYQPNGKGFVVGCLTGTCRFYGSSGDELVLDAEICITRRNKSSGHKITGIRFSEEGSQTIMITSEDSKIHILDGVDVIRRYKGLPNSGSQTSATFTSNGRHIVSVGEDSRVYLWNYEDHFSFPKREKTVRSCETLHCEGTSIALPWPGMGKRETKCVNRAESRDSSLRVKDSDGFSLANWFFLDGACKGSATWPEEKLPLWDLAVEDNISCRNGRVLSDTWGLAVVTGGLDGTIRTFQNYGLPVRI